MMVQLADHYQILPTSEIFVDCRVLAGKADELAHKGRLRDNVIPLDRSAPRGRLEECRQNAHEGRLPRPVGTEKA